MGGGASSHVAIIARSLDISAVAGIEGRALGIVAGEMVVLDGSREFLRRNVSEADIANIRLLQQRVAARKAADEARKDEPAVTSHGHRVTVVANIGGVDDAREAMLRGAEGVGLLRSEFVFLDRGPHPPNRNRRHLRRLLAGAHAGPTAGHPYARRRG